MIPEINDQRICELLKKIKPVFEQNNKLYEMKTVHSRKVAFTWNPKKKFPWLPRKDLKELCNINTLHGYGHYSLFKPSIAEVLAQIPEHLINKVTAFKTIPISNIISDCLSKDQEYHVGVTTLYGNANVRSSHG